MAVNNNQSINLASSFDSFKYNVISYLQKFEIGECTKWEGLQVIELEEAISVSNIEKGRVVGSIMFPKKDDRLAKTFLVQVTDKLGRLKPYQTVVINNEHFEHFNFIPRTPNKEELEAINDIFTKVKKLTYGIKEKKQQGHKKRKLIKVNRFNLEEE